MVDYFKKTEYDRQFYDEYIKNRLPDKCVDMHLHLSLPQFEKNIIKDEGSWAAALEIPMSVEEYYEYANVFYEGKTMLINALPNIEKNIDLTGLNSYLASIKKSGKVFASHMLILPDMDDETVEKTLEAFDGFKPYPDLVSAGRGSEIGIFEFVTDSQLKILNKHKKSMVLHLPRTGRFADDNNISELRRLRDKYPDIKVIIAHCGRSYAINTIKEAYKKMGDDINSFYYDFTAVMNPKVIDFMFEHFPCDKLFYGTDLPIFLYHGKRRWTDDDYFNLFAEDFAWNKHEEGKEAESHYTFFIYEQLKNLLDSAEKHGGQALINNVFYSNAINYFKEFDQ